MRADSSASSRVRGWIELVRLPNVVTAAADSLAGWLLAGHGLSAVDGWLPLGAASMLLYASGVGLNDVFDHKIDAIERPGRPIPSGRVPLRTAAWILSAGLAAGVAAAALAAIQSAAVAILLACAILAYNGGLKKTWLGPLSMGACRGLNFLMGAAPADGIGGPACWGYAAAFALFVAGITAASRAEVSGGRLAWLPFGVALENLSLLLFAGLALAPRAFLNPTANRGRVPLEGVVLLGLLALVLNRAGFRALKHATPGLVQAFVKTGILSLVWIHVSVVAAIRGPIAAIPLTALWIVAFLLARRLYAT